MNVGESVRVGGLDVTLKQFSPVTPTEGGLDGWSYYGAEMSFENVTDGPQAVMADAQVRIENIYVATVDPLVMEDIEEGDGAPLATMRPGETQTGWVVFGVPDGSEILESFGVYYIDDEGNEVVWWNNIL